MLIPGLMQDRPLVISSILAYAAAAHPRREVVSHPVDEPLWRYDYAALARRAAQAAGALRRLGVAPGERVSSLAWTTHRHLELLYAVSGVGSVLHTADPRLSDEQLAYTIDHAESRVLFFDRDLAGRVERIAPRLATARRFVELSGLAPASRPLAPLGYEALLAAEPPGIEWPVLPESVAAVLCYASGDPGDPGAPRDPSDLRGVLYSHRAVVLHALAAGLNAGFGFTSLDVVMPCASLPRAIAWGLPFVAPLCGAKLVLPADRTDGASLHALIEGEGVTFAAGAPTVWTGYLAHLERTGRNPGALRRVMIDGPAAPRALVEALQARHGLEIPHALGRAETGLLAGGASPPSDDRGHAAMAPARSTPQGRLQYGVEIRLADEAGGTAPWDGVTPGALQVRGPWVARRYYRRPTDACDEDGWFDTGEMATVDADGVLRLVGQAGAAGEAGGGDLGGARDARPTRLAAAASPRP